MSVSICEHAGFCYGVQAAVERAFAECEKGEPCWSMGSLIHNRQVMQKLREAGLRVVDTPEEITEGTVILRSHGVPPDTITCLAARGLRVVNVTCPNVARVHKLVESYSRQGETVLIAGQADHPEVEATKAWCKGPVKVIGSVGEAEAMEPLDRALVVAQTTLTKRAWQDIVARLTRKVASLTVANTICGATEQRQREAEAIAGRADVVLVVGDVSSANTRALYETCRGRCGRTFLIESAADIPAGIRASDYIAITAGASTPDWLLKEVATHMNDLEKDVQQEVEDTLAVQPAADSIETAAGAAEATEAVEATAVVETTEAAEAAEAVEDVEAAVAEVPAEPAEMPETLQKPIPAEESARNNFMADIEATLVTIRTGQTITGTVVQLTEDEVCVNIGYKSDGLIKRSDLVSENVKVGDEIEVEVVKVNDGEGNVLLSQRNIVNRRNWEKLMAQFENGEFVTGKGVDAVKGGLIASVTGIRAFIPASQLSQRYVERIEDFIGKEMKLKIIEVDKAKKRIVCSRKAAIQEEAAARKHEIWSKLAEGEVVKGIVRRLTDFGAFVDIGGVDGLIHVTDLSWGRVKHPSELVSPNQEIQVKILSLDPERERIQLGFKQIQPRPWDVAEEKYPAGMIVEGKVVRITAFGAFVELEPGLDGLVHISQCALTRIAKVEDAVQVGQIARVKVLGVDPQAKRISLSIRAALEEEAFLYNSAIPGEDMIGGEAENDVYATPVDYARYAAEAVAVKAAEETPPETVEEAAEETAVEEVEAEESAE
ncbi:MAG: bifunctional 4-hydroxy-3-methylbut-2-enyl diphosphate reductase/30S ribosomal protein S1 [Firmicutes bacterium]|nr:bifunctional 4-hydroxy-3-methylbut-2-enyl diphosphate reductase/30S ribosomal protein S1 [Bacillota bacterium]